MSHYSGSVPDTRRAADWRDTAVCKANPEAMFPHDRDTNGIQNAKAYCRMCPAIERCLQWALETGEEHGVWGGLSEAERRARRRRPARPISIDDYTGIRPTRQKAATLEETWAANTLPDGDHVLWTGPKVINQPGTKQQVTPNRLAFYLDRGHWPEGDTKRACGVAGCVKPTHLTDRRERAEEAELAVAV